VTTRLLKAPGAVIRVSKTAMPSGQDCSHALHDGDEDADGDDGDCVDTLAAERLASFDQFLVWNHETIPEGVDNPHVRGVEEWIKFAEVVSRREEIEECELRVADSCGRCILRLLRKIVFRRQNRSSQVVF
jgi:Ribonuclease H2 non-catalytic subunit (Ylr154p-like)